MPATQTARLHGLYIENQRQLYRAALRFGVGQADAEDLVQSTFLVAYHQLEGLRNEANSRAWLRGILRNLCRNHLRKHARRSTFSVGNFDLVARPDHGRAFFSCLMSELLGPLDKSERIMILLRYGRGMTYGELSAHLRVHQHVAYDQIRRARAEILDHASD